MPLTRDFKRTIVARIKREPLFARALLDEAATLLLSGDAESARTILRDLVNATTGFAKLATLTGKPGKSLQRMLSSSGNPSMENLAAIFDAMQRQLRVRLSVRAIDVKQRSRRVTH